MSAEDWEIFGTLRRVRQHLRATYGVPCPECVRLRPKANPTIMLPQQRCKVDGYRDPRPRLTNQQLNDIYAGFGIKRVDNDRKER